MVGLDARGFASSPPKTPTRKNGEWGTHEPVAA